MPLLEPALAQQLQAFATSLAIGLLMGLERERHADTKAGLRTFGLVAMLGTLAALIAQHTANAWIVAAGLLIVGAMMIAALAIDPQRDGDPGTTTVVALMLAYGLGVAVWFGFGTLAVMLGIAATALLYFKAELHGFTKSLTRKDLISILQFAALTFIVLPILPDRDYGPYGAFNPHQVWWMVVLISGVSLAGYAALRLVGEGHGALVSGGLGGLVSSTATTMVFSRHARADAANVRTATVVILIANLVVQLRLLLLAGVVAPDIVLPLAAVLGPALLLGLAVTLFTWRRDTGIALPVPQVSNPTEIRVAITFGALYALVLLLSAWLQDVAGSRGLYAVALASGLTDVDAITLSSLRLLSIDKLASTQAVFAISLALLSNLVFKSGLVVALGGATLARRTLPGLAAIGVGIVGMLVMVGVG